MAEALQAHGALVADEVLATETVEGDAQRRVDHRRRPGPEHPGGARRGVTGPVERRTEAAC